jgi:hypothetical protein
VRKAQAAIALVALAATLSACGGQRPRGPSNQVINRVLASAPGEAQPSTIVAAEVAFARAAREQGQWTAFQKFAAPGAVIHGAKGVIDAGAWLPEQSNPLQPVQWGARIVTMSCDGATAVSQGRFVTPEGIVGNYVTVWSRQSDGDYKWAYDVAGPDVPQPPPRAEVEDGDIVVTAIDSIQGLVATCPRTGIPIPPPPAIPIGEDGAANAVLSKDGTLRWRWEHREDGSKFVTAEYFYEGQWLTAIEETLASLPEG